MPYRPLTPLRSRPPGPFLVEAQLEETQARLKQDRDRADAEESVRDREAMLPRTSLRARLRRILGR